ncbi:putative membrane protein [Bacteroides fragilis str. 3725 D9(v)]|uniref:Putative membrane protein n=1 Tax=Bacteroides fragilis str. S36L11 TaxID=1339327 RepID=A0A015X013_BACFG|nr:putative membrane protein [Bacteroides fragilis str. 3774 T13]EXZ18303.1 putative membrane protein [Bacteroides fragilis str. J-143-4]EXZ23337.1 putative membrane protein [Bacteroides fragilis str. S13 L11]EXZ27510.1 putative membrane protein [Bacteroides fragilis str. S36L11]EXZ62349.1 putative membrane protein [Bacteroides fragilis str. 3725 D9(v)]EXZ88366.1 putative membrane protein [Bacteroides fragilis str. J38-1]EYA37920.1 putative membrane protein [Bacteroides fragilis str. 20793-3]
MRVSSNRYAAKTRFFCICFTLFICPANIGFYAVVYNTYM